MHSFYEKLIFSLENPIFHKKNKFFLLMVIFEFYAKNAAEWWSRELGSRSVNLFPSVHAFNPFNSFWAPLHIVQGTHLGQPLIPDSGVS